MRKTPVSPWIARLFTLLVTVLAVTGMLQMPLAKRYYVTTLPGLGWTGDYYFTHMLHYGAAIMLMALVGWVFGQWFMRWGEHLRLTRAGMVRALLVAALVITGAARMYKNLPDAAFGPLPTMLLDIGHLVLAGALGVAALAVRVMGDKAYARPRYRKDA